MMTSMLADKSVKMKIKLILTNIRPAFASGYFFSHTLVRLEPIDQLLILHICLCIFVCCVLNDTLRSTIFELL